MAPEKVVVQRLVELLEALAADQAGEPDPEQAEAGQFLQELREALDRVGLATVRTCLKLVPLAQAKGESRAELDLMIDRMDRGLIANCFVSVNPNNTRFPVEIIGTGRLGPSGLDLPARRTA